MNQNEGKKNRKAEGGGRKAVLFGAAALTCFSLFLGFSMPVAEAAQIKRVMRGTAQFDTTDVSQSVTLPQQADEVIQRRHGQDAPEGRIKNGAGGQGCIAAKAFRDDAATDGHGHGRNQVGGHARHFRNTQSKQDSGRQYCNGYRGRDQQPQHDHPDKIARRVMIG